MLQKSLHTLLAFFSKKILAKYCPIVVGITGSVGKSSAKEATAAALGCRFRVRATVKNYNNEVGVPLAIIGAKESPGKSLFGWVKVMSRAIKLLTIKDKLYPEVLVLEMGADKPGDIAYLTKLAPCRVGVLTYISHAHTEFFKSLTGITKEKRCIVTHLKVEDFGVLNFDNDLVAESKDHTKAHVITYGFKEGADLRASDVTIITDDATGWPAGLNFKVSYEGSIVPVFLKGMVHEPSISAALAALAVARALGVNLLEAVECLRLFQPIPGHMRLIDGVKRTFIIDDTYNSSPDAVKSALYTLAKVQIPLGARRFAVLGDMLELGSETESAHREIGFRAAELGVDELITVGEASKITAKAAEEAGLDAHHIASFPDSVAAGKYLQDKLKEGDAILVKGSQGSRMEKIVKEIMAEPLRAPELLVRQSEYWLKR